MRRRDFVKLLAGAAIAAPYGAAAQTTAKTYRIGTLTVGPPIPPTQGTGAILVAALGKQGFTLGQNLTYEARGAAGNMSQMVNLMQPSKAAKVDVVVTVGYPAAAAAKASGVATVIATGSGDPVVTGLVASLARPGGAVSVGSGVATAKAPSLLACGSDRGCAPASGRATLRTSLFKTCASG
jgi:putative tryptophan/tyrosine transport system substrate-binding protein